MTILGLLSVDVLSGLFLEPKDLLLGPPSEVSITRALEKLWLENEGTNNFERGMWDDKRLKET